MKINTKLISLKAFFFCYYAAAGALLPLLTVHLKTLGISAAETGVIAGFTQLFSIFSRPAIGALADHHHKHKALLLLMLMIYGTSYFTLMLIPKRQNIKKPASVEVSCLEQSMQEWICFSAQSDLSYSCNISSTSFINHTVDNANYNGNATKHRISCDSKTERNSTNYITGSDHSNKSQFSPILCVQQSKMEIWDLLLNETIREGRLNCTLFSYQMQLNHTEWRFDMTMILCFLLVLLARVSHSCLQSLLDTITYFMLGSNRYLYSRQRLWGTAGTALSAFCVIFVIDAYYDAIFYMFGGFCILAFFVGLTLDVKPEKRSSMKLADLLKQQVMLPYVRWFLFKLFIYGMFLGTTINFLFWFFKNIGVSGSFLGIVTMVRCFSSLILLQAAPKILKNFGQDICMYAALCAYCFRFLGHSFVQEHWAIFPLELLCGVSFALFWAAASSKISLLAPRGTQGTFQGLAGAIYNDLGRGMGSIVTGVLFERFNGRWTFRAYAIACVLLLVIFCCLDRVWKKPIETKKEELMNNDPLIDHRVTDESCGDNLKKDMDSKC